jgi:hypothetical protein
LWLGYGGAGCIRELLWIEARQSLDIGLAHSGVARKTDRLIREEVCAAEAGDVACQSNTEGVVEHSPACSDNRLRRWRPSHAQTRREVRVIGKAGIVIPAYAQVQRQSLGDFPIILRE